MYSFAETHQLFEFLEADLAKKTPVDASRKVDTWDIASEAIRPSSRFGPLFGLTQTDIDRAKKILDGQAQLSKFALFSKRLVDIVFSATALALLSPLLLAIAISIRVSSPGPVLHSQIRVGRDGQKFRLLKFRSMLEPATGDLLQAFGVQRAPGLLFSLKMDPRVTPVGRFLRRHSLDELPQLWNVLKGEMSLVGPRPLLPREELRYSYIQGRRPVSLKPGFTGLWIVMGNPTLPPTVETRLDLYYIENWSLLGDLQVLIRTIRFLIRPSRYESLDV